MSQLIRTLEGHEDIIANGMRSFLEVGESLMAIRDGKLYEGKYDSFKDYCKIRWSISPSYASRVIESAEVVNKLSQELPIGNSSTSKSSGKSQNVLPENESQARAVADASDDPKTRAKVWSTAVSSAPKDADGNPIVTAAIVRKAAAAVVPSHGGSGAPHNANRAGPKKSPSVPPNGKQVDSNIPERLKPIFALVDQFKAFDKVYCPQTQNLADNAAHAIFNGFAHPPLDANRVKILMGQIYNILMPWQPDRVCDCGGENKGCKRCKGRGWLPKNGVQR